MRSYCPGGHPGLVRSQAGWRSHMAAITVAAMLAASGVLMLAVPVAAHATTTAMAYVTNYTSSTVSVINAATNEVAATINVGATPVGRGDQPGRHPRLHRRRQRERGFGDRHGHQ